MSDPAGIPALIGAIRHMHGVSAEHVGTEHVKEIASTGETVWDGDAEIFALAAHPKAKRAYAWSEATTGTKRRFFAVLHTEPVTDAAAAVRVSILADARTLR